LFYVVQPQQIDGFFVASIKYILYNAAQGHHTVLSHAVWGVACRYQLYRSCRITLMASTRL